MLEYKNKHALIEICIYFSIFLIVFLFLYIRSEYQSSKYRAQGSVLSVFFGQPFEIDKSTFPVKSLLLVPVPYLCAAVKKNIKNKH